MTPTGRHCQFVHWTVEGSLNRTLCTVLTWALTVLWHLHMNLAHLTWCKMLLCTWETWFLKPFKSQKLAMAPNRWLHSAIWCPAYWAENLSKISLVCYGRGSHSKRSKDCGLSGTRHLRAATKGQQRTFLLFPFSSASSPPEIVLWTMWKFGLFFEVM